MQQSKKDDSILRDSKKISFVYLFRQLQLYSHSTVSNLFQGKEDDDDESEEPSSEEPESNETVKNNLAAVEDADDQEAAKVILDEVDEDEEEFQEESDDDIEDKLTPLEQKSLSWFLEDQARTIAEEEAQKAEETRIRKLKEEAKAKANPPKVLPKVRF